MSRLLPYGPLAVMAEFESIDEVMSCAHTLREAHLPGVVDIVPAARTVLVTYDPGVDHVALRRLMLHDGSSAAAPVTSRAAVTVQVRYDGVDLEAVARQCDISIADVIDLHTAGRYVSAFCGFMPGFAYLVGLDQRLHLPRRSTPRTSVAVGSVVIASEFTAIYPQASPGGWHLLGSTAVTLWDDTADPPALLAPGTSVSFEAV